MTSHHSHPGSDDACQRLYGDILTFTCTSCRRTCGPCMGAADDRPELCDDCRAEVACEMRKAAGQ